MFILFFHNENFTGVIVLQLNPQSSLCSKTNIFFAIFIIKVVYRVELPTHYRCDIGYKRNFPAVNNSLYGVNNFLDISVKTFILFNNR